MLRFAFKPRHPVTRVAFTADGREVITAQPFTSVAVRDRLTGEARVTITMPHVSAHSLLAVHPELGLIATHTSRGMDVYDPATGTLQPKFETDSQLRPNPHLLHAYSMWWRASRGGLHAVLSTYSRRAPRLSLGLHSATLRCPVREHHRTSSRLVCTYSPDGTRLVLGDGETLSVFDLSPVFTSSPTLEPLFTLERPDPTQHGWHADKNAEHWLPPVAFDHAGRSLFTLGLRNRVQRIDLATGGVMTEWGWRCEPIRSLAVAPDDLTAAAGCQRGELVLWDLE